ncbi:MAG TPA: twin-arginine translocase subunit TatC, partial [Opitutus sp.]|nr:twin-arginine translocase subunit TatC [Opitutus sp.]
MSEADLPDDDTGVKKSFWDHLRDLRTALLRSVVAIGVGLIVCLLGAKYLIVALEYPLKHINVFAAAKPSVAFRIGNTELGPYEVAPEQFAGLPTTGAPQVIYQIGVAEIGGQKVDTLTPVPPKPGEENLGSLRVRLMNLSPAEAFFVAFRVALYGSLVLTAPFWLFFMGQFFLPALNVRERRVLYQWFGWGVLLFFTGVLLTHFLLLPIALRA